MRKQLFVVACCAVLLLCSGVNVVQAQELDSREATLDHIASELAQDEQQDMPEAGLEEGLKEWMKTFANLSDALEDNPYVQINGFTVSAGFPSGVSASVHLELK